jgi:Asp-tRNA(Asn)/Glu-tRNA(Gln) amidotransferase A subunit family amidase
MVEASTVSAEVLAAFEEALSQLRRLGMVVHDIEIDDLDLLDAIFNPIMLGEAAAHHHRALVDGGDYGPGFRRRVAEGFAYTAVDYIQAQRGRTRITRSVLTAMDGIDVIATPTSDRTAATFAEYAVGHGSPFTRVFNVTGQPSISLPCGFDRHNLPIGLLLSGHSFDEVAVLDVASRFEGSTEWSRRRPPVEVGGRHA